MTSEPTAITLLAATKSAGSFDWEYSMAVMYFTSIPPGTGTHTIDVLQLLHVESLGPSPYSDLNETGGIVLIHGNVAFVDCEPDQVQNPGERGWLIGPSIGEVLVAAFSFGNDTNPFTELWLTFSGTVIPEFTAPIWIAVLMGASVVAATFKKLFKRVKS